jgi:CheY-like chemotaxis protein
VVSDIGLPDGDGCLLMQRLRQRQPKLPGIAMSGYGMEEDRNRSQVAGFAQHIIKPVDVRALDRAIADLLPAFG